MAPLAARCTCGKVEVLAIGVPIASTVCHCDDCQAGARQIEALPTAGRVREADGGVGYLVYRKDRVRIQRGAELLKAYKIREKSATNRMVATCCNSAVILTFEDGKHWVNVFRSGIVGSVPPVQLHICTKYRDSGAAGATVPAFPGYPARLLFKLLAARVAMVFGG